MDFLPEKSFSSNYKNSQLLLTAAAAARSQDSVMAEVLGIRNTVSLTVKYPLFYAFPKKNLLLCFRPLMHILVPLLFK